jgi:hypothetical protein
MPGTCLATPGGPHATGGPHASDHGSESTAFRKLHQGPAERKRPATTSSLLDGLTAGRVPSSRGGSKSASFDLQSFERLAVSFHEILDFFSQFTRLVCIGFSTFP